VTDVRGTHYVRSADGINLAYSVSGDGPVDLVFVPNHGIPFDLAWDEPGFVHFAARLARFSRTVWYEMRGIGASSGNYLDCALNDVVDADLTAVLDAAGCERPVLVGSSHGGPLVIRYCANHPDRVSALVLINTYAHYVREPDYPLGLPSDWLERQAELSPVAAWGTGTMLDLEAPSRASDERFRAWWARCERLGATPEDAVAGVKVNLSRDVRPLLAGIAVPTQVLHRVGNQSIRLEAGRYLADEVANAKFVELSGDDHLFFVGDVDVLCDEIEEFLTGSRSGAVGDVVTAAILFTDIVASTERQARAGPRTWSRLSDHHDALIRSSLARHRGREVKTTDDGFLATFDATGRALRCAAEILEGTKDIGLELRAGVHTGEIETRGNDIAGLAVNIAKRVCDLAGPGEVLVTRTVTAQVVGSAFEFGDRGEHELKGVPGAWRLFTVTE
jgi:class 3 adenylate cyclase